jgi:hypothetical protein
MVVSLCSARSKRVGDYLAGTVVIQERAPEMPAPAVTMPPALASWASQLDLSGLSDELALAIRQYLARYQDLRPEAREALGLDLVRDVATRIETPLPYGVPPWAYLQAVLAERRARSLGHAPAAFPVAPPPKPPPTASGPFAPPV